MQAPSQKWTTPCDGANTDSTEDKLARYFYPEIGAGGFSRHDGTIAFYTRVNALLRPDMHLLDYGAGRGQGIVEDPIPFRRSMRNLRGKVSSIIGVDIDPSVLSNPGLDEAHVLATGSSGNYEIPFKDQYFDLIVADYTFEHIADPAHFAAELTRVLKPSGWICARTPNRWGYIGLANAVIPNAVHVRCLRYLQPTRKEQDVFPTYYRLNDQAAIHQYFPASQFQNFSYALHVDPSYTGNSRLLWKLFRMSEPLTPDFARPILLIFLRKIK